MKTTRHQQVQLVLRLFMVQERGQPCPSEPRFLNSRTRLSALLLLAAAVTTGSQLLFCPPSAHAQGGVPLWTNRYDGPANRDDSASAIAVDNRGNVFVMGSSIAVNDSSDYTTIAYSNSGVPLWTNRYNGPGDGWEFPAATAVDSNGNVFVTGGSYGGSDNHSNDYATIAYSNSGAPLSTNRYDGPANGVDVARAIVVDSSGNVFVTGESSNGSSDNSISLDYATIKYSNAGVPLWTNRYDGPGNNFDEPVAIAVDASGNVFVTGSSAFDFFDVATYDYATVAYSSTGELLWINLYDGPESRGDLPTAIAVDRSGNVFVTGWSGTGTGTGADYATIAYSNAGVPLWTNRYNGPANGRDEATAIALDADGNVFVTGRSIDSSGLNAEFATIKYSSAGVPLWTRRYHGPRTGNGWDSGYAIAVDRSGNVFVTGESPPGSATIAYSGAGVRLWTNRYDGFLSHMAVDSSGNVFVTGGSSNGAKYDFVTIKYSSSVPSPRLDFQKLNNELVLSWTNAGFNLQTAPAVTGPFTNILGATSPYTNIATSAKQFFRLISD